MLICLISKEMQKNRETNNIGILLSYWFFIEIKERI